MSDKINSRWDVVFLAPIKELFDGLGWHGKGTPLPLECFDKQHLSPILWGHKLHKAVAAVPVFMLNADGSVKTDTGEPNGKPVIQCFQYPETGQYYAVADDSGLPVGDAVGKYYHTPTNALLFETFEKATKDTGYSICSAGTLDTRREFFVDAKSENVKVAGRDISPYVGMHRMFGGISKVVISGHQTVIQCGNTSAQFLREAARSDESIQHKNTLTIEDKLPLIVSAIKERHSLFLDFTIAYEQGALYKVTRDEAREALVGYFTNSRLATRAVNRVNAVLGLFQDSPSSEGESAVCLTEAMTNYLTHSSVGDPANYKKEEQDSLRVKQWYSSERGASADAKTEIMQAVYGRHKDKGDKAARFHPETIEAWRDTGRKAMESLRVSNNDKEKAILASLN